MLSLIDPIGDEKLNRAFAGYLPLLIELRSYAGLRAERKCESFLEFLDYTGKEEGWHITEAALRQHLKNDGRAVVIFDGLDEIFDPEDRERITRQIVGFASDYPSARIIATSRIIGYRRKILSDADFTHFTLQDLNESQVDQFVSRWYELALSERPAEARDRRERILSSFRESPPIRQLAGNPMLLTIMAIIGKHQKLPRERWKLYDHAASVLIEHWDVIRHLSEQRVRADFIGEEDKKEMLRRLASRMQAGAGGLAGNYIHRDELQAEFESYLKDRYAQTPDRAKEIAQAIINQLRERNFILSLYGANLYGFVHRAFLEYFCATAIIQKFEKSQEITLEQLKRDVYGEHLEDQSWHEVLRLICGMVDEKFAGEIIDYLTGDPRLRRAYTYSSHAPWDIALAAQCLGEVRNPGAVAGPARRLLKVICRLFEIPPDWDISFLEKQIIGATEIIGQDWPHRSDLAAWLKAYTPPDDAVRLADPFGVFIGSVGRGLNEIHQVILNYFTSSGEAYRLLAARALAKGWRNDPQTLPWLMDRAANDSNEDIRKKTIQALISNFPRDEQITSLLFELSQNAPAESTRVLALAELTRGWQDDPRLLPLLDSLVDQKQPESVRLAASTKLLIRKRMVMPWTCWLNGGWDETDFGNLSLTNEEQIAVLVSAVRLRDIRVFTDTGEIRFDSTREQGFRPVTLLLGDNAAGKSTLLRCIALAALGPDLANQAEKRPESYLKHGADRGFIEVLFQLQLHPVIEPKPLGTFCVGLEIRSGENNFRAMEQEDLTLGQYNAASRLNWLRRRTDDRFGFVCGYGALRGLADNPSILLPEEPKEVLDRVASLFRSSAPLMDPDVLCRLLTGDLSNFRNAPTKELDTDVRQSMASHLRTLLPDFGEISSHQSPSVPLGGVPVPVRDLSDSYGSLLALIGHYFRHALSAGNWKADPAEVSGIALIDEIDLHLHPAWQRRIVPDLRRVFPTLQIIGTSHSAIVAGSVATDSIIVLRREGERLRVIADTPSFEGWRADQILTSLLFDLPTTRNLETEKLLSEYARLLSERGPDDPEVRELGKSVSQALNMEGEGVVDCRNE